MIAKLKQVIPNIEYILIILAVLSFSIAWLNGNQRAALLNKAPVYQFDLKMTVNSNRKALNVYTYLPESNVRQTVLQLKNQTEIGEFNKNIEPSGTVAHWFFEQSSHPQKVIRHQSMVTTKPVQFEIPNDIQLDEVTSEIDLQQFAEYLKASEHIEVNHPEIAALWSQIKPKNSNSLADAIHAMYDYVVALESLPFKGTTSALTALRLQAASCNGKSRLFVALARHVGIPARLIGGVVLEEQAKRTSHQWIEILINDHWVPFDPTNQHFAKLPVHYLELYRGDESLFKYTKNIQFDYEFKAIQKFSTQALLPAHLLDANSNSFNLVYLLKQFELADETITNFLLFPLCALIITFFRNMVGLQTFGVFIPMLIAASCAYTGLKVGLIGISLVILIAYVSLILFEKMRLLKVPRLAASISLVTVSSIGLLLSIADSLPESVGILALFPIIIVCFIAEKLCQMSAERDWKSLAKNVSGTLVVVCVCYYYLQSTFTLSVFAVYPEVLAITLALQIIIGRWSGVRLSELIRFRKLLATGEKVVGINERNRRIVYKLNTPASLKLAADKLATKDILTAANIPVPETIAKFSHQSEVSNLHHILTNIEAFVIKPNAGSQGNGIVVITSRKGEFFYTASGKEWSIDALKNHISEIISGSFSQLGESDVAYIEPLIQQHQVLNQIAPMGLCDIRIIATSQRLVAAMLRIPTLASHGKANLHQGAIGASVNLETGIIERAVLNKAAIQYHPDTAKKVEQVLVPHWQDILEMAQRCAESFPLGYLGIDICVDQKIGPLILEVNGRPGLEIQNIQAKSLPRHLFAKEVAAS